MSLPSQTSEQRKHKRYKVTKRAFAVLGPEAVKLCHLIDISRGGLAFRYFVDSNGMEEEMETVDILGGEDFYLEKVPVRTVSDNILASESPFSSIAMRRRGVQFGPLTQRQREQVDYFIENSEYCGPETG
jgi:hypothetical protein